MPNRLFNAEQKSEIIKQLKDKTSREVINWIKETYGMIISEEKFKSWRSNNKVICGKRITNAGKSIFSEAERKFILEHIHEWMCPQIAEELNKKFGTNYTKIQIRGYKHNHKIYGYKGPQGYCESRPNPHKGEKGWSVSNGDKTRFVKGNKSHNRVDVGTEIKQKKDGYWKIKVAEPNVWRYKHRMIWEAANGPIPEGASIIFLDNNPENLNLNNLYCLTRQEQGSIRKYQVLENQDLTKASIGLLKLKFKIKDKSNGTKNDR